MTCVVFFVICIANDGRMALCFFVSMMNEVVKGLMTLDFAVETIGEGMGRGTLPINKQFCWGSFCAIIDRLWDSVA